MLEATRARAPKSDESTLKALKSELKKLQAAMAEPKVRVLVVQCNDEPPSIPRANLSLL